MRKLTVLLMAVAMAMVLIVAACDTATEEEATETPTQSTATSVPDDSMDDTTDQPRVVFSDLNWASAQLQNRIAQYILETGYGYETDVVFGATLPLLQGLRAGDTHITMEIWLPNQESAWVDALAEGVVQEVGFSLGADWQSAFVIPRYLQEEHPELDSIEDLKDPQYKALFETPDSDGKARLVSCVIGWACEGVNDAQIVAYGLEDHVFAVKPGDGAAANADLYGAYERQEPWLGYQWGTNDPALLLDLVRLEEPAFTEECWSGMQAFIDAGFDGPHPSEGCGYRDAEIKIAVRSEIVENEPELVSVLQNWSFDIPEYGTVVAWQQDNPNADIAESALWWLNNNEDEWSTWVTSEAAQRIHTALGSNVIPAGWPTE